MILFTSPGSYVKGPVGSDANIIHNNDGSCTITDQTWAMSDGANSGYVPISPLGKTYYYDITYSNTSGNQFYIGVEKFDSNKKSGSNSRLFIKCIVLINLIGKLKIPYSKNVVVHSTTTMSYEIQ